MPTEKITIPEDLLRLKPSSALESVSMSRLARQGTAVLRQIVESAEAVAVNVQGKGEMVTLSQRQYDEIVVLIHRLQEEQSGDGFTECLSRRFDELVAGMNQPGAADAINAALFAAPEVLNANYRPGSTERGAGNED